MSTKQQAQTKVQKPEPARQTAVSQVAQLGPELLPAGLGQVEGLNGLPLHNSTRGLRQTAVLQMQRQQGNTAVQRYLTRSNGNSNGNGHTAEIESGEGQSFLGAGVPTLAPWPPPNGNGNGNGSLQGAPVFQRQEDEDLEDAPTEAEKAAALAAARDAEASAAQAQNQSQQEIGKANASSSAEEQATQAAKEKEDAAKTEAGAIPKEVPENEMVPEAAPEGISKNGSGPQPQPEAAASEPVADVAADTAPASAAEDPGFTAVVTKARQVGAKEKSHAPAKSKADAAQDAAIAPTEEVTSQAQAGQVGEMEAVETPPFDKAAFKARLMQKIEAMSPKTAEEADSFKAQDTAGSIKGEMAGEAEQQAAAAQGPLEEETAAAPDTSDIEAKPVTPLEPEQPGGAPPDLGAAAAVPKPKGQGELEAPLQAGSQSLDQQMAEAEVTEAQLAQSNEPEFTGALASKKEAQTEAVAAPQAYRQDEAQQLAQAQTEAETTTQAQTEGMHADRVGLFAQVEAQQGQAKTEDEQARAEIAADIQKIYEDTQTKVETILNKMDQEVADTFEQGAAAAKQSFENYIDSQTEAHKQKRYGGLLGWGRWIKDKFKADPEIDRIAERGKQLFITEMDAVIDNVVEIVARGLTEAKAEIANGKKEIETYVAKLPADLQQVGQEAANDIDGKFNELEATVDSKQDELIDSLASKYQENLDDVNARVEAIKEANKGLIDRAVDAVGGAIKTILQLKEMLLNVLSRVAAAVSKIIKDPIGFLGNLIEGVKLGLNNFVSNIGAHLKEGLVRWLTGAISGAGITLPRTFDLPGIFQLVMQLLGVSFEQIMAKVAGVLGFDVTAIYGQIMEIVGIYREEGLAGLAKFGLAKLIGQEGVDALMKVVELFQALMSGSFGKLWELIQEHLTNLKEMVFGKIQEYISESVIKAGITWIISLFNPAGAFIKACKMIYDVIMFFVQRGKQIASLVNAVIDSVAALASGNLSAAATAIEQALARAIPVAISFLSSLLGLGDISGKVKEIIQNVRAMVDNAIDILLNSKPVQMVAGFIKKVIGKVKNLAKAGFEKAKGALGFGKEDTNQDLSDENKEQLKTGKAAFATEERNYAKDGKIGFNDAQKVATGVKQQHSIFASVKVVDGGDSWDYEYIVQRTTEDTKETTKAEDEKIKVTFAEVRHLLKRFGPKSRIKKDTTIILEDVDVTSVKQLAQKVYADSGGKGKGEFESEGIGWTYEVKGPKNGDRYLHIHPVHSPPKALQLGRPETKGIKNYLKMRNDGMNHEEVMAKLREREGVYNLTEAVLAIIERIK
jgi:hypothetical protein